MKLYCPPIISAKRKIVIGHGVNIVYCDVLGRLERLQSRDVLFNHPAWNHHGRRMEALLGEDPDRKEVEALEISLSEKVALFGAAEYKQYRDTSTESMENTRRSLLALVEKGYAKIDGEQICLNLAEIYLRSPLLTILNDVKFSPPSAKHLLLDLVRNLNNTYALTKQRKYATPVNEDSPSEYKINPILDLSLSPGLLSAESVDYAVDGSRTVLHGTFIPFVVWSSLFGLPFARNVAIHGYAVPQGVLKLQDVSEFQNVFGTDVMRYCVLQATNSLEDTKFDVSKIRAGQKLHEKIFNLAKYFRAHEQEITPATPSELDMQIVKMFYDMKCVLALDTFQSKIFELSKSLTRQPTSGQLAEYMRLLNTAKAIFPSTEMKARVILSS